ncbi:MAG: FtsX-like permease family protein [Nitriliruptor sp.]|nr:MAG: FtsX-like permease family protein [Nitriliruptor sp.]
MTLATRLVWLELRRTPSRLLRPAVTLTVIAALAMVLAALVDTLDRRSTGVLRAVEADLVVFNVEARQQVLRSRVPRPATIGVGFVDGVHEVGVLSVVPTTVTHQGDQQRATLVGFNARTPAEPVRVLEGRVPTDGEPNIVAIDAALHRTGIEVGDRITLGGSLDVEVVGVVAEAMFLQQPTVWAPPEVWARTGARAFPERGYAEAIVGIGLVDVQVGQDPAEIAPDIVAELAEEDLDVEVVPLRDAIAAVPGVSAIRVTFGGLVALAIGVVVLVSAGLALLQVDQDRSRSAELRAIGAGPRVLAGTLLLRLGVTWALASTAGALVATALAAAVPAAVPLAVRPTTLALTAALLGLAVGVGGAAAVRRMWRIDPAEALGEPW